MNWTELETCETQPANVSIYYKPSLFNAHTMIFIVHIFMNVNKLCLNQPANVAVPLKFYEVHQNWHKSETLIGGLNQV